MKTPHNMISDLLAKGWSQDRIAAEAGFSQGTVSNVLRGSSMLYENAVKLEAVHQRACKRPVAAKKRGRR